MFETATKTVWVLGAGQLGRMMQHAAMPLAIDVRPIDLNAKQAVSPSADDVVTAEIEAWPENPATESLYTHPNFVNREVFGRLADRLTQKQLIDELDIATSPWMNITEQTSKAQVIETLGEQCLLKQRRGGYDGRGQLWLNKPHEAQEYAQFQGRAIAEQVIPFDEEVSLVGARDREGRMVFYPLTLNLHVDSILTASISPLARLQPLQAQAETMLGKLMTALDYVGVMAMECFRIGDRLLVNELAPRVHNSGHWTQRGANASQFEQHIRAVAGLPLADIEVPGTNVMINLVGTERSMDWYQVPGAAPYWYGKSVRDGRKVGHINFTHQDQTALVHSFQKLLKSLPKRYTTVMEWVINEIQS